MAEPKTEIERRLDKLEAQEKRTIAAVSTLAYWLVQAQTGFGQKDAEGIEKILRGEDSAETKENGET